MAVATVLIMSPRGQSLPRPLVIITARATTRLSRLIRGRATISPHEAITGIEVTVPITGPVMVPVPETVGVADREVDNRGGLF